MCVFECVGVFFCVLLCFVFVCVSDKAYMDRLQDNDTVRPVDVVLASVSALYI